MDPEWDALARHLDAHRTGARLGPHSVVVVSGPPRCGKTTGVLNVLKGWDVTALDCWNARELRDRLVTACRCPLVASLSEGPPRPRALLLDSLEFLLSLDPTVPAALWTLVSAKSLPHVVLVCVVDESCEGRLRKFPAHFRIAGPAAPSNAEGVVRAPPRARLAAARHACVLVALACGGAEDVAEAYRAAAERWARAAGAGP